MVIKEVKFKSTSQYSKKYKSNKRSYIYFATTISFYDKMGTAIQHNVWYYGKYFMGRRRNPPPCIQVVPEFQIQASLIRNYNSMV